MSRLIITRGLPASGKTTKAREWVAADPVRRARVNRDDIRAQLHDSAFVKQTENTAGTERTVQAVRDATISALLKRGVDVVSDDTNLPTRTARDLRRLALLAGADFEVWDLTDVPYEECARRNGVREGRAKVPDAAMLDMCQRFVRGKAHPLPLPEEAPDAAEAPEPYVAPDGAPTAIMCDLDGTAAVMCDRSPYDETRVGDDLPNPAVIQAVHDAAKAGHHVIFCSGRTDACEEATLDWLRRHVVGGQNMNYLLFMRKAGDTRKDSVVKVELFDRHIRDRFRVVYVLDDRDQVVRAWRALGLTVFQVAPGDF